MTMPRVPTLPSMPSRGGREVTIYAGTRVVGSESFLDVLIHYPPLHTVIRGNRVYEVVWSWTDVYPGEERIGTIYIVTPLSVRLEPPPAISLAAIGARRLYARLSSRSAACISHVFTAYGFISRDTCSGTPLREYYDDIVMGVDVRDVRSALIYATDKTFERHFQIMSSTGLRSSINIYRDIDEDRSTRRLIPPTPYLQPVVKYRGCLGAYPFLAYKYKASPILHELAEKNEKLVRSVTQQVASLIGIPQPDILLPDDIDILVSTPPRFYPLRETHADRVRRVGKRHTLTLGGLTIHLEPLMLRLAVALRGVYARFRGMTVRVDISKAAAGGVKRFGDVIETQGLAVKVTLPRQAASRLSKLLEVQTGEGLSELRDVTIWKVLYHVVVTEVERLVRDEHPQIAQMIARSVWRLLRLLYILRNTLDEYRVEGADVYAVRFAFGSSILRDILGAAPGSRRLGRLMASLESKSVERHTLYLSLRVLDELDMLENLLKNKNESKIYSRAVESIPSDYAERISTAYRAYILESSIPSTHVLEGFLSRTVEHTILHWLMAEHVKKGGLGFNDISVVADIAGGLEDDKRIVIYEVFDGGVGVSWSLPYYLRGREVEEFNEWAFTACTPLRYQHQLRAILSNPDILEVLWSSRARAGRETLREIIRRAIGEEPLDSVVERVSMLLASERLVSEAIAIHKMYDVLVKRSGTLLRPHELATLLTVLSETHSIGRLRSEVVAETLKVSEKLGIARDVVEEAVNSLFTRLSRGYTLFTTRSEVEENEEGESPERSTRSFSAKMVALMMEEYGLLWWLDAHPMCHANVQCGRELEESDINAPLPYLSPKLTILLAGVRV